MFLKSQDSQEIQNEMSERACAALPVGSGLLVVTWCLC